MIKTVFVAIALLLMSARAGAQTDPLRTAYDVTPSEQAALIRLANEIGRLRPLIREAEANADPSRRFKVRYDWLLRDIERIKHGVEDAAAGANDTVPRDISALKGAYEN